MSFMKSDGDIFLEHIRKHISDGDIEPLIREPQCKICELYLSQIVDEFRKRCLKNE